MIIRPNLSALVLLLCLLESLSLCPNFCSGHGYCSEYDRCVCVRGIDGEVAFRGADCSLRTCPKGNAWVGEVAGANNVHPPVECSNKGICDTVTGTCQCFDNYEGLACERTICPENCSGHGECYTAKQLADEAGMVYDTPWDANKHTGCVCDAGYRGYKCHLRECPSGADTMKGFGNEAGRDCSGRGICDYTKGRCKCFTGFSGARCEVQVAAFTFL
eukprot:GSChrysophyteH1.ASY1.ANO1.3045.1 assembled CDS